MPWEETENEIRHRVKEPELFQQDQFASIDIDTGVRFVIGRLKGEKTTTVQAIRFDKKNFTMEQAKKWVADHKDKIESYDEKSDKKNGDLDDFFEKALIDSKIDKDNRIIRDVLLLQTHSKNNRVYPGLLQQKSLPLYEGVRAFLNHSEKDSNSGRDIRDLVGRFKNPRYCEGKIRADLHLLKNQAEFINDIAEMQMEGIGFSHHAKGKAEIKNGIEEVTEISKVLSVDLVVEPATTTTVFENINDGKENSEMDIKELSLEQLKKERPDLVEQITKEILDKSQAEIDKLKAEIEKMGNIKLVREQIEKNSIKFADKKAETEFIEYLSIKTKEDIDSFFKYLPKSQTISLEKNLDEKLNDKTKDKNDERLT